MVTQYDGAEAGGGRWPRRLLIAGTVLFAIVVTACLVSLYFNRSSLNAQRAAIRARGEPADMAELLAGIPPLPPDQDTTQLWTQAAVLLATSQQAPTAAQLPIIGQGPPPPPLGVPWPEMPLVEQYLADNAEALKLMHDAAARGGRARIQHFLTTPSQSLPATTVNHDQLGRLRACARALLLEAKVRSRQGDSAGTAESVQTGLALAQALADSPLIVAGLMEVALFNIAIEELRLALPYLDWHDEDLALVGKTLLAIDFHPALRQTLLGERVFALDTLQTVAQHSAFLQLLTSVTAGGAQARYFRVMADLIAVADRPWPEIFTLVDQINPQLRGTSSRFGSLFNAFLSPALTTGIEAFGRAEIMRRLALLAVAIERYRLQAGRAPDSLSDLVPRYLDALPDDPTTGAAFEYRATADGYVLWCGAQRFIAQMRQSLDPETGAPSSLVFRRPAPPPPAASATDGAQDASADEQAVEK